mmetsp:Transcript_76026/g.164519  ORF Transcript_76026/g.164519 Transcript_76026/m.164519 type:complete len:232 (+) Transcript_76026:73-768(+)
MCTLKPPFDAHSLQYLAMKIVSGKYAPIPSMYSKDMRNLVSSCLSRDPNQRPRVHEILALPLIKDRIKEFLTKTQQNMEFNHTVIHKKDLNQIYQEEHVLKNKLEKIKEQRDKEDQQNLLIQKSERESRLSNQSRDSRDSRESRDSNISNSNINDPRQIYQSKPSVNVRDLNSEKLKDIDNKLEQLRIQREERKKELEDKRIKREEERQKFLQDLKDKDKYQIKEKDVEVM